jgi:hypothetical protein
MADRLGQIIFRIETNFDGYKGIGDQPELYLGLLDSILECEQERLSAQMSGLETGWEHPNTQSMWGRVITIAKLIKRRNLTSNSQAERKVAILADIEKLKEFKKELE